jgi:hypothetical protein
MLSVKIMATPKRTKYIPNMLKSLNMDKNIVMFDDRKELGDAMYNAKRCWLAPLEKENVTHRLVLQDDLELVNDFMPIITEAIKNFPDVIWSLYNSRIRFDDVPSADWKTFDNLIPYVNTNGGGVYGQAIIIPVKYIDDCFKWIDIHLGKDYIHDDRAIGAFAFKNNIPVYTTIPSTVQHLAANDSTLKYNNKKKISKVYIGKDLSNIDWTTKEFHVSKSFIKNKFDF